MLRAFGHPVLHQDMLGVVGSKLKLVKLFMQHLWMLRDVVGGVLMLWRRQRGRVVRAQDLKSVGRGFKSRSDR